MKQFKTFLSAIEHHSQCVICNSEMQINDRDLAADIGYRFREGKEKITFFVNQREQDTLTIHLENEEIEVIRDSIWNRSTPLTGKFLHALTLDCKSCCQFSYTLQIHIDLSIKKLTGIFLNSENISIEDKNTIHEIKNIYSTEQTEYAYFPRDGSSKKVTFPLIPLNLMDPKETINRIRQLLIFS